MQAALSDPMVLAAGLQIVRNIGLKRIIIPIVAIGGIALGLMASRRQARRRTSVRRICGISAHSK
jgi:thiamine monophosphate synthase